MSRLIDTLVSIATLAGFASAQAGLDTFGITKFYPTKAGTREWTSAHWANGNNRVITYAPDPDDPTGWTDDHSASTNGFHIDGKGTMTMSGGSPRFHINSTITSKVAAQLFENTEYTAYYMRKGASGAAYGGMIVGARSGPLGHASSGGNDCDATTYYGRFRNDGKWDVEKELKHPGSTYWSGSGFNTQDPLWHGALMPQNRWIGMKYLVYNIDNDTHVKFELYIDTLSNGNPVSGGHWEKVGTVADTGNWTSGDVSGCNYAQNMIIIPGHGTFLMRTDNDTAVYKMVSIREIDMSAPVSLRAQGSTREPQIQVQQSNGAVHVFLDGSVVDESKIRWSDLNGKLLPQAPRTGLALVCVQTAQGMQRKVVMLGE